MLNFTAYVESAGEFGGIGERHLDEDDVVVLQVVVAADLAEFVAVLGPVSAVGFVGDQPDGSAGCVAEENLGRLVEVTSVTRSSKDAGKPGGQETARMAAMKTAAILTPSGRSRTLAHRGVDEDQRDHTEGNGESALPGAVCGERHRHGCRGDQDEDSCGVRAALGIDARVEDDRDR